MKDRSGGGEGERTRGGIKEVEENRIGEKTRREVVEERRLEEKEIRESSSVAGLERYRKKKAEMFSPHLRHWDCTRRAWFTPANDVHASKEY